MQNIANKDVSQKKTLHPINAFFFLLHIWKASIWSSLIYWTVPIKKGDTHLQLIMAMITFSYIMAKSKSFPVPQMCLEKNAGCHYSWILETGQKILKNLFFSYNGIFLPIIYLLYIISLTKENWNIFYQNKMEIFFYLTLHWHLSVTIMLSKELV